MFDNCVDFVLKNTYLCKTKFFDIAIVTSMFFDEADTQNNQTCRTESVELSKI